MGRAHGTEPQCYQGLSLTVDEPIRGRGGGISTGVRPFFKSNARSGTTRALVAAQAAFYLSESKAHCGTTLLLVTAATADVP